MAMNKRQRKKLGVAKGQLVDNYYRGRPIQSYNFTFTATQPTSDAPKYKYRWFDLPATTDGDAWYRWATAPPKRTKS